MAKAKANRIDFLAIPPKMTHIYQPADQFVIVDLRQKVTLAWHAWVEALFAKHSADAAVARLCAKSLPVIRKRMYSMLGDAVNALGSAPIVASWEATGIMKHAYGQEGCRAIAAEAVADAADLEIELPECFEGCDGEFICDGCWRDHSYVTCTYL